MDIVSLLQMVGQNAWIYGAPFILVLSVLVFVHEWGHYIVARMCGVRVETFSIGFGKEIWGMTDKSGTRWKVSLIPLGGYVQMFGDSDPASARSTDDVTDGEETRPMTDQERKIAFFSKPVWQRAAIVFAGPAINYIFAIVILAGLYISYGQPVSPPTAAAVVQGSAAEEYGFQPHDYIVSIDGKHIKDFSDIRLEMTVALDQERHFVVQRNGELIDIHAKPNRVTEDNHFGFTESRGVLGILGAQQGLLIDSIDQINGIDVVGADNIVSEIQSRMDTRFMISYMAGDERQTLIINPTSTKNPDFGTAENPEENVLYLSNIDAEAYVAHSPMTATQSAIRESYVMTRSSLEALWQMVVGVRSPQELGGIIRIGAIAGERAQQGFVALLLLTAILSINLGFINLLPIPMLDGGHLVFYGVETIIGRPVPEIIQDYAFRVGFIFLIGIMVFANGNDLYQLLT